MFKCNSRILILTSCGVIPMCFPTQFVSGLDCEISPVSMSVVKSCPSNQTEWTQRSLQKNCPHYYKQNSCSQPESYIYHCLINHFVNITMEVCAQKAYINSGFCAEYNIRGALVQTNYNAKCQLCPKRYLSSEAYKYQECYNLTKKLERGSTTESISNTSKATIYSNIGSTLATTTPPPSETKDVNLPLMIAALVGIIILIFSLCIFISFRKRKTKSEVKEQEDVNKRRDEEASLTCHVTYPVDN